MCVFLYVIAQKIHASSETYLALIKDNAYELQLRGEVEVKVHKQCCEILFLCSSESNPTFKFDVTLFQPFII